jgi:hypothetical protein
MDDLQARLAGMGEGERTAAARNAPNQRNMIADVRPGPAAPTNDPMQFHGALAAAPPSHQAIILQRLRLIDRIAQAIGGQTRDPVERARMAQHFAQIHPEMGVDPGMLTPQSMSDENIASLHELATEATLRVALAKLNERGAAGAYGGSQQLAGPAAMDGANPGSLPVQRVVAPHRGAGHAAQGFTILGVN